MPRGAPRGRGRTRHVRQGPGVPGPPVKNGPVWRNPDHAPSRRATPLMGRKKRDGQTPSPTEAGGDEARLFDKLNRMHECHCVVPLCSWARPLSVRPHESGDPVFAPARLAPGSLLARDERRMILFDASPNDDCVDLLTFSAMHACECACQGGARRATMTKPLDRALRVLICSLIATLVALATAAAEAPFRFEDTPGRLPKTVVPIHYSIELAPDFGNLTFSGAQTVDIEVRAPTDALVLHAVDLTIASASIEGVGPAQRIVLDPKAE